MMILAVLGLTLWGSGCATAGLSPFAAATRPKDYAGRYVGGGAHFGQKRHANEGTWAREYVGMDPLRLVQLRWSHSKSFRQGGRGCY